MWATRAAATCWAEPSPRLLASVASPRIPPPKKKKPHTPPRMCGLLWERAWTVCRPSARRFGPTVYNCSEPTPRGQGVGGTRSQVGVGGARKRGKRVIKTQTTNKAPLLASTRTGTRKKKHALGCRLARRPCCITSTLEKKKKKRRDDRTRDTWHTHTYTHTLASQAYRSAHTFEVVGRARSRSWLWRPRRERRINLQGQPARLGSRGPHRRRRPSQLKR